MFAQNRESSRGGQLTGRQAPRKRPVVSDGQVLLVENLRERSRLMCDMLSQERFAVKVVEGARDAVQLLSQGLLDEQGPVPELIICNARMVGEAGLEALGRLCTRRPEVPVILLSAFTSPKLRERMGRIPGACVLDQAFGLEDLRSAALALATSRRTIL